MSWVIQLSPFPPIFVFGSSVGVKNKRQKKKVLGNRKDKDSPLLALPGWFWLSPWWCLLVFHPGASHGVPCPCKNTKGETRELERSISSFSSQTQSGTQGREIYPSKRTGAIARVAAIKPTGRRNLMVLLCLSKDTQLVLCLNSYLDEQLVSSLGSGG